MTKKEGARKRKIESGREGREEREKEGGEGEGEGERNEKKVEKRGKVRR